LKKFAKTFVEFSYPDPEMSFKTHMPRIEHFDLSLLDTQIEYLENVNRRLEALGVWRGEHPEFAAEIGKASDLGIVLVQKMKALTESTKNDELIATCAQLYSNFIYAYETIWKQISDKANGLG
jgi:hypothetical protein